jgi:hypothetical protein
MAVTALREHEGLPLTALPQLSWIFWGACPWVGSRKMPMVSPGQTLRRPNWRDTRIGPAISPVIGLSRAVGAAPDLATALGYDIEAALDDPDGC